jgi:hypothetical protein
VIPRLLFWIGDSQFSFAQDDKPLVVIGKDTTHTDGLLTDNG